MMGTSPSEHEVRTTDLTLATFLIYRGWKPGMEQQGETSTGWPIGAWVFSGGPQLEGDVNKYSEGFAKVEPLKFHKAIKTTRREMYDKLGIRQGKR
jgi:hypothetical protein